MKTFFRLALAVCLAMPLVPAASAGVCVADVTCVHWDCVQVYPWSRLCQGDVVGFLEAYLDRIALEGTTCGPALANCLA